MSGKHAVDYAGALNQIIVHIAEPRYIRLKCKPLTPLETLWYSRRRCSLSLLAEQFYSLKNGVIFQHALIQKELK